MRHEDENIEMFTGSCHCGQISYRLTAVRQLDFFCHCLDCRKLSGGGRLSGIAVNERDMQVIGQPSTYIYPGGSGKDIQLSFCGHCSTQLFAYPTAHSGIVVVRANTLDDEAMFCATKSLHAEKAFQWDRGVLV